MSTQDAREPSLRDRAAATLEASALVFRALRRHRMGAIIPLVVVLLLTAFVGTALGLISPFSWLPRGAQVVPFVYPLF
jgi:hypothetical protein